MSSVSERARQPELQRYFASTARKYGVETQIRFDTEVQAAEFDEASGEWRVHVRAKDGATETLRARVLISGVGQLNRPKLPDIEGLGRFRGPAFHSACWDHSVSLAGKRVAVIGTGASAFQLVPEIAKEAAQVYSFQRTPQWMFPNPDYHRAVSEGASWCFRHLPYYGRWYRFLLFWPATDGTWEGTFVDPQWPHQERSINAINEFTREMFTDWIRQQCGDDEALFQRVLPKYPPLARRTLQDNGSWLQALRRDNVQLVDREVVALTETAVRTADGAAFEADVVVYATGFHANRYLWPMEGLPVGEPLLVRANAEGYSTNGAILQVDLDAWAACVWTPWLPCSTATTAALMANGCPTATADAKTTRPSSSCARPTRCCTARRRAC